jgi:hypothetical protein
MTSEFIGPLSYALKRGSLRRIERANNFLAAAQGCQMVYSQTKKYQFGYILEGLGMEIVVTFCDLLE